MNNTALAKLIWVLIYGGLLCAVLGMTIQKTDAAVGWSMVIAGAVVAGSGVVLVVVRSRRKDAP